MHSDTQERPIPCPKCRTIVTIMDVNWPEYIVFCPHCERMFGVTV